jgi:hypothetical protein
MAGETINDRGQPVTEKIPLWALLRTLTIGQAWALAGAIVAVIVGSAAVGALIQSVHDEEKAAEKDRIVAELKNRAVEELIDKNRALSELAGKERKANANVEGAKNALAQMEAADHALKGKAEFLERYLTYNLDRGGSSKNLFIDHVCALWMQAQEYNIRVGQGRLEVSNSQLRLGLAPEVRKFLQSNGVSFELLDQAAVPDAPRVSPIPRPPDVTRSSQIAIDRVQEQIRRIPLTKIVRFYDGTTYKVPDEIAVAVHSDSTCRPR